MRIAYFVDQTPVFGGVRIIAEHLNRLTDRGHACALYRLEGPPLAWLPTRFNQYHIQPAPDNRSARVQSDSPPVGEFDAVVATSIGTWRLVAEAPFFKTARRYALVQMMEALFFPEGSEERARAEACYSLPLRPIAISQWLADEVSRHNTAYPPVIVPNGVDFGLFRPKPFIHTEAGRRAHPRLLIEGYSHNAAKGYSHNAAKDVDEMAYMAVEQARRWGWRGEVWGFSQFAPRFALDRYWTLPAQDIIPSIYSSCDIMVKATRFEGRPGPDLEAMACGCVVNRAILKGDDDLRDGENCLKVAYGDQAGFAKNLMRLIADADLRARLRKNGLMYVAKHKDWNKIMPRLERALAA